MSANVSALASEAKRKAIVARTLAWWDRYRRSLAWRAEPGEIPDPYRVWLSEVLLQQTTAQAATPYYQAFIAKWPRVEDLAAAPIEDVMSAFAGLGYYSRARNLHACAKEIARRGGTISERGSRTARASGRRRLYRGRDRCDRLRPPDRAGRRQYRAHSGAAPGPGKADRSRARRTRSGGARAGAKPQGGRFRPSADGHWRDALPPPQSRLRPLPASGRLRGVPSRRPGGLPAPRRGEGETAPARRCVLRSPLRRRLPRAPPPAPWSSGFDH